MYTVKKTISLITIEKDILVYGKNLQASGLPITFESLGKMWDLYTEEDIQNTISSVDVNTRYGLCLNKIPDYVVGIEVEQEEAINEGYLSFCIPKGQYIQASFNGENWPDLVGAKLMTVQKEMKSWARKNKVKINLDFTVEIYQKEAKSMTSPEMLCLYPILK